MRNLRALTVIGVALELVFASALSAAAGHLVNLVVGKGRRR